MRNDGGAIAHLLQVGNFVLFAVNVGMFVLWWSMIRQDALPTKGEASEYVLSHLTLQITILAAVIGVGALIVGALAIFGFKALVENAEAKADAVAKETVATLLAEATQNDHFSSVPIRKRTGGLPDPGNPAETKEGGL